MTHVTPIISPATTMIGKAISLTRLGLRRFHIQVSEDRLEHYRILETGDDSHYPATGQARLDVNPENRVLKVRSTSDSSHSPMPTDGPLRAEPCH